jgi:hypothetical protein
MFRWCDGDRIQATTTAAGLENPWAPRVFPRA